MTTKTHKVARNSLCPCGSGMKYKRCCLKSDAFSLPLDSSRFSLTDNASAVTTHQRASATKFPDQTARPRSDQPWFEVVFNAPLAGRQYLNAVLLFSEVGLRASTIRQGEILTLDLRELEFQGPATVLDILPSKPREKCEGQVLRVVKFRDDQGDDLGEPLLGDWKPPREVIQRWRDRRRFLTLKLEHPQGGHCDIQLERKLDWIEAIGAEVGGMVFLDLAEMGARGWAKVLAIDPCPEPEIGPGQRVTGTFRHSHGWAADLVLESETDSIGVTPLHLFWSVDRSSWVPVGQLRQGETLKTLRGFTKVVSYTLRERPESVYNLEVDGDHVYRVGDSDVLVHNQSTNPNQSQSSQSQPDHVFATGFGANLRGFAADLNCLWPELAAALRNAKPLTETAPFNLTVTRNVTRPDPHSIAFGQALANMRSEIAAFVQTAAQQGSDTAKSTHKARIQNAWLALVDAVEDPDVAQLVPQNQQNLVSQGRQTLQRIKFSVAQVIDAG